MNRKTVLLLLISVSLSSLSLAKLDLTAKASPNTIRVPQDYPTLQAAINAANEGDTIYAYNGTYNENIAVNKRLSLIGENRNNTIINGYYIYKTSVVSVTSDGVRISGFTIQNGWCGIAVHSSKGCVITENRVMNNTYRGGGPLIYESSSGVSLINSKNCTVVKNIINDNDRNVYLKEAHCNTVMNNTILNSFISWGIILENSDNNSISKNVVKCSIYDGIYLARANDNLIVANVVTDNEDEGIQIVWSNNTTIVGNNIMTNSGEGIWLDWSNGNTMTENTIISNKKHGILVWHSAYTIVYHNNFINNLWGQAYSNLISTWEDGYRSGGNYWSDYDGTDTDGDGIGDSPYIINNNNQDSYPLIRPYKCRSSPIPGDINRDTKVNDQDLFLLAVAYGSTVEDENWNPQADLNEDGTVNYADLFILVTNYGKGEENGNTQ